MIVVGPCPQPFVLLSIVLYSFVITSCYSCVVLLLPTVSKHPACALADTLANTSKLPQAHEKMCDENERKKVELENDTRVKMFLMGGKCL